jgi:mannose-6-phosphate isomerase-like protein (cupin superfamily)
MIDNNIIYCALKKQCFRIAAITVIVPLLLFSSIEFSGYNNSLSLVKNAVAQPDSTNNNNNNDVYNIQSNISNQSSSTSTATTTATTTTNATSRNDTAPFVVDIISLAKQNNNFRQEIKTAGHTQVVLMSLKPGEDIGLEVHKKIDQLLMFVQGTGEGNINGQKIPIKEGSFAFVPAGTPHNFVNTGNTDLKLFTTYSPPNHYAGTLQKTKAETAGYVPPGAIEIEDGEYEDEDEEYEDD